MLPIITINQISTFDSPQDDGARMVGREPCCERPVSLYPGSEAPVGDEEFVSDHGDGKKRPRVGYHCLEETRIV